MDEPARVDSFMEANDAEAMFPGSARAFDRSLLGNAFTYTERNSHLVGGPSICK